MEQRDKHFVVIETRISSLEQTRTREEDMSLPSKGKRWRNNKEFSFHLRETWTIKSGTCFILMKSRILMAKYPTAFYNDEEHFHRIIRRIKAITNEHWSGLRWNQKDICDSNLSSVSLCTYFIQRTFIQVKENAKRMCSLLRQAQMLKDIFLCIRMQLSQSRLEHWSIEYSLGRSQTGSAAAGRQLFYYSQMIISKAKLR